METAYDILFFWVARMIMDGLVFTGQVPFHTVYLHGLIRDEHGKKMSKSYGNVIDPLPVMEEFGTDALRFALLVGSTPGHDTNVDLKKVESNRNFANKIWNVGRFVINALDAGTQVDNGTRNTQHDSMPDWSLADSWIWAKLQQLVRDVERLFQSFQYGEAGRQIYDFFWSDFADWYVEIAKGQLQNAESRTRTVETLVRVLDTSMRLLHPFTPFVTEELWGHLRTAVGQNAILSRLAADWPDALIVAKWPGPRDSEGWESAKIADFTLIQEIIRSIRNLRAEKNAPMSKRLAATIVGGAKTELLKKQAGVITALAALDESQMKIVKSLTKKPEGAATLVVGAVEIHIPLAGMVDESAERERLTRELAEAESHIARLEKLLASDFANKAPAPVVAKEREKLAGFKETAEKLKGQLA
jgi:valyl-tRNA synthetase